MRTRLAQLAPFWRWLGWALTIVSLIMLWRVFAQSSGAVTDIPWSRTLLAVLVAGVLVMALGHFNLAGCWYLMMRTKYPRLRLLDSVLAVGLSQVGKYLPGNLAHVLGRAWLLRKHAEKQDLAFSFVVETVLVAASACLVGVLFITRRGAGAVGLGYYAMLAVAVLIAAMLLYLASRRIGVLARLELPVLGGIVLLNSLIFVLFGAVLVGLAVATDVAGGWSLLDYSGAFALAFLLGYVLPGAPGGLGVREYAFVLLANGLPETQSLKLILLLRLVTVAGDLLFFLVAFALRGWRRC